MKAGTSRRVEARATAPTSYSQLRRLLQVRLPQLSPGQRRIARVLLTDPEGSAFRTIGEMARMADIHESSVVRFATSIGLDGYPSLVDLCRQQLAEEARLIRRFDEAREHDKPEDLLATIASNEQRNVERTFARIDQALWKRAVKVLAESPTVHVIGLRKCFAVAYLLTYLLHLVRRDVHQLNTAAGLLVDELRDLSAGEAFVAVAIHRYTADTVNALAYAHRRGLHTIVLTDNPTSPLVEHAQMVFYVETSGVTILRSLTAFNSLVQALATAVAIKLGTVGRSQLLLDEELQAAFRVFSHGPDGSGQPRESNGLRARGRFATKRARRSG